MRLVTLLVLLMLTSGCSVAQHCDAPKDGYSVCHYTLTTQPACEGSCKK